ncbi:MAG: S-methyl-5-thioribose-1-phosphate isomerase [Magnetococcus sp. DMHC-6]
MMKELPVVGWQEGLVYMLDQRILPREEKILTFQSAAQVAQAITSMVIRGAPAIGCAAAFGVAVEAYRLAKQEGVPLSWSQALEPGLTLLRHSRPTAINLSWALDRMAPLISTTDPVQLPERLLQEAQLIHAEDVASCRSMGRFGAEILPQVRGRSLVVMTHCNAGALATAGYGTALGVIRAAWEKDNNLQVIATETRPFWQGARLTAWELLRDGIATTLITDSMSGYLMSQGNIDAVVVGADRVAANGDVANKIGTYMHAVLAYRHKIPFYVACPLSTIDLRAVDGQAIPIEERPTEEVTHCLGQRIAALGVGVRNPAFDVTPAQLVTALVTEKGVVENPDRQKIAKLFL